MAAITKLLSYSNYRHDDRFVEGRQSYCVLRTNESDKIENKNNVKGFLKISGS